MPRKKTVRKKVLYVTGEINDVTSAEILRELTETKWVEDNVKLLEIFIVSEGGFLKDCFAIIDYVNNKLVGLL